MIFTFDIDKYHINRLELIKSCGDEKRIVSWTYELEDYLVWLSDKGFNSRYEMELSIYRTFIHNIGIPTSLNFKLFTYSQLVNLCSYDSFEDMLKEYYLLLKRKKNMNLVNLFLE